MQRNKIFGVIWLPNLTSDGLARVTSAISEPWTAATAPVVVINLKFSENMPRFVLEVRKFQDPSLSHLGDI